jgi:hypothetical protein
MTINTRKDALLLGESQYFTGKPCVKGHVAKRRTKTGECLKCRSEFLVQWRLKNPQRVKAHNDTQYLKHSEELVARAKINYQRFKEAYKPKVLANVRKRQAAKLQRTPKWLTKDDVWMMQEAYHLANLRTKLFGFSWHVDHVIPLQGKLVSGLHTPYNLQVVPAKENLSKFNRYEVI